MFLISYLIKYYVIKLIWVNNFKIKMFIPFKLIKSSFYLNWSNDCSIDFLCDFHWVNRSVFILFSRFHFFIFFCWILMWILGWNQIDHRINALKLTSKEFQVKYAWPKLFLQLQQNVKRTHTTVLLLGAMQCNAFQETV